MKISIVYDIFNFLNVTDTLYYTVFISVTKSILCLAANMESITPLKNQLQYKCTTA